jgi:glycosyltransferase involved in cell wall biosynthesis
MEWPVVGMEISIRTTDTVKPAPDRRSAAIPTPAGATRRLKVLHVGKFYPPHMGGIETHLQALCGELCKLADVRVTVASDDRSGSQEMLDGVRVTRIPTQFTLAAAPICAGMVANIRDSGADIVHIHLPNPIAVLAYLASKHRGHLIASYHSDTVRQRFLGAAFEPFLHAALRRSSAIVAASAEYQRTSPVLARYQDRCHVIPYGIAVDQFQHFDPAVVARIRKQYGERLVLAVGRLVYYKGFEYLVRAMTQVNGNLLIVGDGPLRGKLADLTTQLRLGGKVHFAGNVPGDLTPYYHAADLFALPSVARSEAFGIVQIEAMAAGKPVVNTQLDSGVPYVSLHERTGLTVPPADPDALTAALNRLLDHADLRRCMGEAARARARQEFSLETMTSRMMALYEQVAGT